MIVQLKLGWNQNVLRTLKNKLLVYLSAIADFETLQTGFPVKEIHRTKSREEIRLCVTSHEASSPKPCTEFKGAGPPLAQAEQGNHQL